MPLPLIAAVTGAAPIVGKIGGFLGNVFKKKPGGTKVGNLIRGIFGKKPSVSSTPPIAAQPASPLKVATTTTSQKNLTTAKSGSGSGGVMTWIKENTVLAIGIGVAIILLFGNSLKKLFR